MYIAKWLFCLEEQKCLEFFSSIQKVSFHPDCPPSTTVHSICIKLPFFVKKLASKKAEKNGLTSLELAAAFIQIVRAHRAPLGRLKLQSL